MDSLTKRVKSNFKNKIKGKGAAQMSAAPKTQQQKLQDQLANYETRLQNIGIDPKAATDTRNPLEKVLNLKQDQNALFDVLELIGRPQQALFTGIDNAIKGKDFVKGLKQGISGEKETSGGKILRDLGMEGSGKFNLLDPKSYKEFSLSDVLGLGLDIFADPMDLLLAPVKVADVAADTVKVADKASDVLSKGTKLVRNADTLGDTVQGLNKATSALNVAGKTAENVGKQSKYVWKPLNSALLSYAGQGIKKGAKISDNVLEKILSKSDAKSLKKARDFVAKAGGDINDIGAIKDALREMGRSTTKLDTYRGVKNQLGRAVDSSKNLMGLTKKAREIENASEVERRYAKKMMDEFSIDIDNIANNFKELGFKSKEEAVDAIWNNLPHAIESNRDWTLTGKNVIDRLVENKSIYMHSKANAEQVADALKKYGIKVEIDGDHLKLLSSKNKLYAIQDAFNDIRFGSKVSKNAQKQIDNALALFNKNDDLKALYNKAKGADPLFASLTDTMKGTNLSNIATNDYVRHSLNENISPSEAKAFNARKYDAPIAEVNEMKRLEREAEVTKLAEKNKKIEEAIYTTDASGKVVRNKEYVDDLEKVHRTNIDRLKRTIASQEELKKGAYDTTGKRIVFDPSKVDINKLNKKDLKLYNQLIEDQELKEVNDALRKIKFDDIPPKNTKIVNDVRAAYTDYTKWVTSYKQELMKKKPNQKKLDFIRAFVDSSKKRVTAQVTIAQGLADKQASQAISKVNRAYKEGKSLGAQIEKASARLSISQKRTQTILDSLTDNLDALEGKLNFENEALNNLLKNKEKVADDIFNKKLKTIENNAKAISTLSDPEVQDFFKTNFKETFMDFVNRSTRFTEGASKLNDALSVGIFNNPTYIKTTTDLANKKVPYNFEKVSSTYLKKKIGHYEGILSDEGKAMLKRTIENLGDDYVYLDKDFAKYLGVSTEATKEISPLLKFWDGINNAFKKFSTLTLGFQERNIIGNSTNMVLSGVPAKDLPEYYAKANNLWNKADELLEKAANKTLEGAEKADWETLQEFYKAGFLNAFEKGQGLENIKNAKGLVGKASKLSVGLNEKVDTYNRLALLMYAKDHPKYVEKLGRKNAVDAVKMVLFDPSNTSDLERNAFKRIIPFYTFTKQNLMFQAENLMKNTPRYNKLFKALNKSYEAIGEDSYYQYQKENMQIPLPFKDKDGNQLFLKANLPVSDLGEFLSKPTQRIASSTSPIIKTPYELTTGKNTFTGEDINYNTLTNTLNKLGVRNQGAYDTAQAAEVILNNFGLQNVSTNLIKKVQSVLEKDSANKSSQQLWAEIFKSVLQNTKQENVINSGLYDQLEAYQTIIKRLKNQGVSVPTMTEINQVNKMKLNKMKNKRAYSR